MSNEKFTSALYSGKDIPDVLLLYEKELRKSSDLIDVLHANKIKEYRKLITDKNLLYRIRSNFNEIYKLIDKRFPDICFSIDGRRKSLVSVEEKIQKYLSENKSLDLLRDIYAFRIILFGHDSKKQIKQCYDIANAIIEYSLHKGITICQAEPMENTISLEAKNYNNMFVPEKSGILKIFQNSVKDYILNPKSNGYQSLHILFRTTTGEYFEVQIRTFSMHINAETGEASHDLYKQTKYKKDKAIEFDCSKVQIPGFGVASNGQLFDFIGLIKGLEILKRQKTY